MMSIALENNSNQVSGGGFMRTSRMTSCGGNNNNRAMVRRVVVEDDEKQNGGSVFNHPCSSSSSSIGKNSDDEDFGGVVDQQQEDEDEVQSIFNSAVDALEQALPIRRGISKFYNGKSKSFASLADAACSSIKDITKPENAYSRKRKNLLAYSLLYDKGRSSLLKSSGIGGGIAKRPIHSSRSTLALAVAMNNSENSIDENGSSTETNSSNHSRTSSISPPSSPLSPSPWRSFSLVDLQYCAVSASAINSNLSSPLTGKRSKPDEVFFNL